MVISSRHTVSCPCVRRTEPTTVPRPFHDGRAQPVHRLQADSLLGRRTRVPTNPPAAATNPVSTSLGHPPYRPPAPRLTPQATATAGETFRPGVTCEAGVQADRRASGPHSSHEPAHDETITRLACRKRSRQAEAPAVAATGSREGLPRPSRREAFVVARIGPGRSSYPPLTT